MQSYTDIKSRIKSICYLYGVGINTDFIKISKVEMDDSSVLKEFCFSHNGRLYRYIRKNEAKFYIEIKGVFIELDRKA